MKIVISFLILISALSIHAQDKKNSNLGKIFENPPDSIAVIFAKDVISVADRYEYGLAISPDWDEIFFTAVNPGDGLMRMKLLKDGNWTSPAVANLRGNNSWEFEAFYSPDGKLLLFSSNVKDTSRIWISVKNGIEWGKPVFLDSPVNNTPVFWSTISENGTLYYSNLAVMKIFKSQMNSERKFDKTENAGLPYGSHPFISKDGSYILFNYMRDIYVAFKRDDNKWNSPVKLGSGVNTSEFSETCPSLSPDEKYLFFSRYNDLNQKSDIYWVSTSIIANLRKQLLN